MTDAIATLLSKVFFGGSIVLILYLVYYEWKSAKIRAQNAELELGEKKNEDYIGSLSDEQLVDLVNKNLGSPSDKPPTPPDSADSKKPTS